MSPEEQVRVDAVTAKLAGERYYIESGHLWKYVIRDAENGACRCATDDFGEALMTLVELQRVRRG